MPGHGWLNSYRSHRFNVRYCSQKKYQHRFGRFECFETIMCSYNCHMVGVLSSTTVPVIGTQSHVHRPSISAPQTLCHYEILVTPIKGSISTIFCDKFSTFLNFEPRGFFSFSLRWSDMEINIPKFYSSHELQIFF